ncbi:MAG TPA: TonB-dependent receptor [Pedobacter sp.]|uniref:TonB-dependent receptor domain-containing protein n=1 Tax=Pedobacter sp. TaxID=1411316 RepID=UPI002CF79C50|nr:TonB-dependent receptor [Pedobacter sp.]HMI01133.1 TonB-dependent receptor [Pedobacter sp.]
MYSKYLVLLLFISSSIVSIAQTTSLKGIVIDAQTKQPIEYASIAVLENSTSGVVSGGVSNKTGAFKLEKIKPGKYDLRIAFIGYITKSLKGIDLKSSQPLDLGTIILEPGSKVLEQVSVTGTSSKAMYTIDKQIYKTSQFEAAKGGTAIDALKNLPSVAVDGEGNINLRGSSGFLVLVNGKAVLTDAQTVLSQIPANALENIEVITSPSAKYDPDGKSGIINIITKKGVTDGFTMSANALAGLPSTQDYDNKEKPLRFGGDLTINLKENKWDITISGNYTRNDNAGYREGNVFTKNFQNNTITRFPSNGERSFDKYNYGGRTAVTFSPDASNTFSAGFFAGHRYQGRLADIYYNNTTSDLSTGELISKTIYFNSNLQTKKGNFTLGNLDYTHTFANKSALTASALYERAKLFGQTVNRNLGYPDVSTLIQEIINPYENPIAGYRLKLDYVRSLGKGKLETGYQFRHDTQDGKFDYFVYPISSQPDADQFRGFAKAKNQINSIYTQYSGKSKDLEYSAGMRYEYAARTVTLSNDPDPHILNLSNLFPSASLLYSFNTRWKVKAAYSKRVQRRSNFELNPIPEREHSETLEQGDPDLLPEFIDLVELGIVSSFSKGNLFANLYYQGIKNPIQRVNSVYADTILNRVFTNATRARSLGLEAGGSLQPASWWTIYLGTNIYKYKINGSINVLGQQSAISNADWVYSINGNSSFRLSQTISLQAAVNYLSERPTAQGWDSRFLVPSTILKKSFMGGAFSASLQWQNMDLGLKKTQRQRITTMASDFYTTTNYIYEPDVFLLNFSFNLNKLSGKSKLPSSEFGDKEF